jgi:hypothetical protein
LPKDFHAFDVQGMAFLAKTNRFQDHRLCVKGYKMMISGILGSR